MNPSFKLDEAIAKWRTEMTAQGVKSPDILDELESHLREAAERRIRSGEQAARAFELAVREVGDGAALKTEFAKTGRVHPIAEKLMLAVCTVFMAFIIFLSGATVVMCFRSLVDRIVSGVGMAATLIVACCWSRAIPRLPVITNKPARLLISVGCILAGIGIATFYCQVILPFFGQPYDHQIAAAGFWMLLPVAAGFGLGCGIDQAGRRHIAEMAS